MLISWIAYMSTSFHAIVLYNYLHAMTQDTYMLNTSYFMKPCLQVISWNHDYKLFTSYFTKIMGFLANYIMFMFWDCLVNREGSDSLKLRCHRRIRVVSKEATPSLCNLDPYMLLLLKSHIPWQGASVLLVGRKYQIMLSVIL